MKIILASQSPRRRELMGLFRLPFSVEVADIDETMDHTLSPFDAVAAVSLRKAQAICRECDDVVIAADTIVVCDGEILGKPSSEDDAKRMLQMLSGKTHQVMTGLAVLHGQEQVVCTEVADVFFRPLEDREISAYVATKEPMYKAGIYGIQGGAALFVEKIHGDYYNVMGLPVCRLWQILKELLPELMEEHQ